MLCGVICWFDTSTEIAGFIDPARLYGTANEKGIAGVSSSLNIHVAERDLCLFPFIDHASVWFVNRCGGCKRTVKKTCASIGSERDGVQNYYLSVQYVAVGGFRKGYWVISVSSRQEQTCAKIIPNIIVCTTQSASREVLVESAGTEIVAK